jgi:hypothetical protein
MFSPQYRYQKAFSQFTKKTRDGLLMVSIGLLAGSVLPLLNNSFSLTTASASSKAALLHPDVAGVHYRLSPQDPSQINQVWLQLGSELPAGFNQVNIRLNGEAGSWIPCFDMEDTWVCPVDGVNVNEMGNLEVISS